PIMSGLEVIPLLKADYPDLHIIVVTKYSDPKFVRECLQLHKVSGYVLKTSSLTELLEGLKEVSSGKVHISKNLQLYPKDGAEEMASSQFDEAFLIKYHLTKRELEILVL